MNKPISLAAMVFGFLAAAAAAVSFQISFFYLSKPAPVEFYISIMEAEGKSLGALLLPFIVSVPIFAVVAMALLWWAGREPGLKLLMRGTSIALAAVWIVLTLNFMGFVRFLPASILPPPAPGWVTTSSINAAMLLRLYFRMFRPGLGITPIEQAFPWLVSIAAFPVLGFLFSTNIYQGLNRFWKSLR